VARVQEKLFPGRMFWIALLGKEVFGKRLFGKGGLEGWGGDS